MVAGRLGEPGQHRGGTGQAAEEQVTAHIPGPPDRLLDDRLAVVRVRAGPGHHELFPAAAAAATPAAAAAAMRRGVGRPFGLALAMPVPAVPVTLMLAAAVHP